MSGSNEKSVFLQTFKFKPDVGASDLGYGSYTDILGVEGIDCFYLHPLLKDMITLGLSR